MEVEEIQAQACKFPRIRNGSGEIGPDEEEDRELRRVGRSSRIIRVSRASGGKDRHSKVWTSKGLRDRRVRLSVSTAIQFYDLQDRLGYDQPSKAVDWLINAADVSISDLPELNASFPETPTQLSDKGLDSAEIKSTTTSETTKASSLSLAQSEVRVNSSSFTELLTASPTEATNLYHKAPMEYFRSGHEGPSSSTRMQPFHLGNSIPYNGQQFSYVTDHFISHSSDYNLNFTMSPYNSRGTLQSNSHSFAPPIDGNASFFLGTAENHHHQQHIFYGLQSDHKDKGNN